MKVLIYNDTVTNCQLNSDEITGSNYATNNNAKINILPQNK